MSRRWKDLDLDLDLLDLDLALLAWGGLGLEGGGDWDVGLGLAGTEKRCGGGSLPATPRFLFPRKAGCRGYLG